jgi:hypothetical protein
MPISYADIYENGANSVGENPKQSYKQSLLGGEEDLNQDNQNIAMDAEEEVDDDEFTGLKVVEKKVGPYDCPEFILSEKEETRIQKPWRQGLIVKLMGRRIGYKALETRLKQIWVRKGVISIIDLGYEYFLVYFTNEEDYTKALEDGPWLIYDHYLITREWTPNFHPNNATIERAAVWVRISGLPIEYYDAKILHYIGNRIGQMVKVDRNTLLQERGKYARVCVEVDLNKPLLAMFELKGEVYKVEYEGLHMLCRRCGKFGHYVEGCPEKNDTSTARLTTEEGRNGAIVEGVIANGNNKSSEADDGPWVVVQKPRRARKAKDGFAAGQSHGAGTGSRFDILENINEDPANGGTNTEEIFVGNQPINDNIPHSKHGKGKGKNVKHVGDKKGKGVENKANHELSNQKSMNEKSNGTHAATIAQNIQARKNEVLTRGENQGDYEMYKDKSFTSDQHAIIGRAPHNIHEEINRVDISHVGTNHAPRPPEGTQLGQVNNQPIIGPNIHVEVIQAQRVNEEDMEIVAETPNLDQEDGGAKSMILA